MQVYCFTSLYPLLPSTRVKHICAGMVMHMYINICIYNTEWKEDGVRVRAKVTAQGVMVRRGHIHIVVGWV